MRVINHTVASICIAVLTKIPKHTFFKDYIPDVSIKTAVPEQK